MANIRQEQGPFPINYSISIKQQAKIGISIGQKDFMYISGNKSSFKFIIDTGKTDETTEEHLIWMGRSCIYETDDYTQNNTTVYPYIKQIIFPQGAPQSCLVNITLLPPKEQS